MRMFGFAPLRYSEELGGLSQLTLLDLSDNDLAGPVPPELAARFDGALQVWAAAASDPALRQLILPMEAKFARAAHQMTVAAIDPDDRYPDSHRIAQVTLDLARGLGLADTLSDDSRRRAQVVATWTEMVTAVIQVRSR